MSETRLDQSQWIYHKLYVGSSAGGCDALVRRFLPSFVRGDHLGWFFIRYFDEGGFHIRLRVRVPQERAEQEKRAIAASASAALAELPSLPPADYKPLIPSRWSNGDETTGTLTCVEAAYEPEYDKFGGTAGMPIAERLFEVSSDLAVRIVVDDFAGTRSRKDLAPSLMDIAARVILKEKKLKDFWRKFANHWLQDFPDAGQDWLWRFSEKSKQLSASGITVPPPPETCDPEVQEMLQQWRSGVEKLTEEFNKAGGQIAADRELLALNFVHLMNNRMGISYLEESYLATLLAERL